MMSTATTMALGLDLATIILCCVAIGAGAGWLVDSAARIARRLGLSELVIGLTVVAIGTSAPEFAVTIGAAIKGYADLSLANVVGSNLFNLGFILGLCAAVRAIETTSGLVWRDGLLMVAVTALLLVPVSMLEVTRWQGAVMVLTLAAYLAYLAIRREPGVDTGRIEAATWRDGPWFVFGLAVVIGSSHFLVEAAVHAAGELGISEWLIGMTIVAAGTSIPELAVSMVALRKGHHGISAGNLIGSSLFNVLGVLGLAGLIRPLAIEPSALAGTVELLVITVLAVVMAATHRKLSRIEGVILILATALIWAYNLTKTG